MQDKPELQPHEKDYQALLDEIKKVNDMDLFINLTSLAYEVAKSYYAAGQRDCKNVYDSVK